MAPILSMYTVISNLPQFPFELQNLYNKYDCTYNFQKYHVLCFHHRYDHSLLSLGTPSNWYSHEIHNKVRHADSFSLSKVKCALLSPSNIHISSLISGIFNACISVLSTNLMTHNNSLYCAGFAPSIIFNNYHTRLLRSGLLCFSTNSGIL